VELYCTFTQGHTDSC